MKAWIALIGVPAAIVFGGVQACQSATQSEQTERALKGSQQALNASTAVSIYQEEREVQKLVTPKLWRYFKEGERLRTNDPELARKAYVVAGAFLDHFEHLRAQADSGAFNANRGAWGEYITWSFRHSPLLCSQLRHDLPFYGGDGDYTVWGQWGEAVCGWTTPNHGWTRCGNVPVESKHDRATAPSYAVRPVHVRPSLGRGRVGCPEAVRIVSGYAALPREHPDQVVVSSWLCAEEFGGTRVTCTQGEQAIRWQAVRDRER